MTARKITVTLNDMDETEADAQVGGFAGYRNGRRAAHRTVVVTAKLDGDAVADGDDGDVGGGSRKNDDRYSVSGDYGDHNSRGQQERYH